MSAIDLADLTAYLRTIGLTLDTVENKRFPFRLLRSDGQGSAKSFKTSDDVWRHVEIQAFLLFRHVATTHQVVEDLKSNEGERRALWAWFVEGGTFPSFVQERRETFWKPFPGDLPPTWKEELGSLMALPATISPYEYVPSFIAVLAYALRQAFPDEAAQWLNRPSNNSDGMADESAGAEQRSADQAQAGGRGGHLHS